MLRTTRSIPFCSRKLSLKVNTARGKSSCGTTGDFEMVGPAGIDAAVALRDGIMRFALYGTKLRGQWTVLKTRMGKGTRENWLLQKVDDEFAEADYNPETEPASALSGKVPRGRP